MVGLYSEVGSRNLREDKERKDKGVTKEEGREGSWVAKFGDTSFVYSLVIK